MDTPDEYIERRIDELNKEYERVLNVKMGEYDVCKYFEQHRKKDLATISGMISDYRRALRLLQEDKEMDC